MHPYVFFGNFILVRQLQCGKVIMTMTRREIRRLNRNRKQLTKLTCNYQRAAARERQEWEDLLIQRIREAQLNKLDLAEFHIELGKILDRRKRVA